MTQTDTRGRAAKRMEILRQVAEASDAFYLHAQDMASQIRHQSPKASTSQMRNLETLANSTRNVTHVFDLVKTQVGRKHLPREAGQDLLTALSEMGASARRIAASAGDESLTSHVHLQLCREYLRHLTAQFEYEMPTVLRHESGRDDEGR